MAIKICVPTEVREGEKRVALVPDSVNRLVKQELEVCVQASAGERIGYFDEDYSAATIINDGSALLSQGDITLVVNPLTSEQIGQL
ncbi:MAG: NAD(P)(+) transhydrogenase (Re/Si-specific) subunit alpha, partial [Gammaproteobacteria bacterium]